MKKLINFTIVIFLIVIVGLTSCNVGPQKIKIGKDVCSFCKMSVADNRYGAEIVTKKGKIYIFDDTHCLIGFMKANTVDHQEIKDTYFADFNEPHELIASSQVFLMQSPKLRSPMGGNIAAFNTLRQLKAAADKLSGAQVTLEGILK